MRTSLMVDWDHIGPRKIQGSRKPIGPNDRYKRLSLLGRKKFPGQKRKATFEKAIFFSLIPLSTDKKIQILKKFWDVSKGNRSLSLAVIGQGILILIYLIDNNPTDQITGNSLSHWSLPLISLIYFFNTIFNI